MSGSALLVDTGDLPSLAALAIESRPQQVVLFHALGSDPAAGNRRKVVNEHAAAFSAAALEIVETSAVSEPDATPLDQAIVLMHAAGAAQRLGCTRIVWPRQVGPDPGPVGEVIERAHLVAELARLGSKATGPAEIVVDAPIVDLTDAQVADLADDCGAPLALCWPCREAAGEPCRRCTGCRRWRAAFDEAGVGWPWGAISHQASAIRH